MRVLPWLLVCVLAVPAAAQSPALERAIRLYDRKDFYSASVELQKILADDAGGDTRDKQRAELFMGKTLYQLGFHVTAWSRFASITQTGDPHVYFGATLKWLLAILRVAPSPSVRNQIFAYRGSTAIDDPSLASVKDELAYQLGRELANRDVPRSEALEMLARVPPHSPFAARAQLEIARALLRDKDLRGGIAAAMTAARTPALAIEAAYVIASWTHIHRDVAAARTPLDELASSSAYARYQLSRAMLDGKPELPGLDRVTVETFDSVMLPSACRGRWPDDIKPVARSVIAEARPIVDKLLGLADHAELFDHLRRIHAREPMPGTDVVIAVMSDPIMRERLAWVEQVDKELAMLQRTDRAWQATQAAAEVLQELTLIQAMEMADTGLHARQRLQLLARDLDVLEKVLADASPAFALAAGPDVALGSGLVVTGDLCRAGNGTAPTLAGAPGRARGCAGCASSGSSWSFLVLGALVLAKMKRRARTRLRDA